MVNFITNYKSKKIVLQIFYSPFSFNNLIIKLFFLFITLEARNYSYRSHYGGPMIPDASTSANNPNFALLLSNEFKNDTELTGFLVHANTSGLITLKVFNLDYIYRI